MSIKQLSQSREKLLLEIEELRARLAESEKTLNAIRNGEVDAVKHAIGLKKANYQLKERKRADEKNQKLIQSVLDNVNSGVALIDETGRFTVCNPLFLKLFGLSEGTSIKNVNDQNWAEWKVFNEDGTLLDVDDHPVRKVAITGKRIDQQLVGVRLPSGGDIIWMLISAEPLYKDNGKIEKIICTYHDITEHRKVEEIVRESEERYRNLFTAMPSGVIVYEVINDGKDLSGKDFIFKDINPSGEKIDQVHRAEILGKSLYDFFPKVQEMGLVEVFKRVWQTGVAESFPVTLYSDDKISLWVTNYIWRLPSGELVALFDDITERRKAEEALKISEERFRLALNNAPVSVAIQDSNLVYTWAFNQKTRNSVEIIGKTDADLFAPEDLEWINPLKATILKTGKEMNVERWVTSNGKRLFLGIHYEPILDSSGKIIGIGAATVDLTTRKLAEEILDFQSQLLSEVNDAVFSSDSNYTITYWNKAAKKLTGWTKEEVLGRNSGELLKPKIESSSRDLERSKLRIAGHWEGEVRYIRKDGTYFIAEVNSKVLKDSAGKDTGNVIVARDISGRKRAEEELKNSEERFRNLVKYAPTAIYEIDFTTRKFTSVNDSMCKLSGYSREELMTFDALDLLDEDSKKLFLSRISKSLKGEKPDDNVEYKVRSKDGRIIYAVLNMKFNFNEQGTLVGALVVGHDITERKRAAEELHKAGETLRENEAKLKELIATKDKFFNIVAHDLKNPFTSLIGSSEILYANINNLTPEQTRSLALLLNDSAKRGYSILLNLLDWSRSQTGLLKISTSETNLTHLIDDNITEQQLSASNKNISIINETEEDIYLITDGNILNTVLRNLLSNSIKFTRKSGKVVVAVTKETDNVTILVIDNGIGISPDRIGKLFNIESRNSTPGTENEQGTGLGLKLSKEFIEKLGGRITVESIIDTGSTFRIMFPLI